MRGRTIAIVSVLVAATFGLSQPAQPLSCNSGPFIVFFDQDSAVIKPDSAEIVDFFIRARGQCAHKTATMLGFADKVEDPSIALERAEAVRAYAVAHGFPFEDIAIESRGASQFRVPNNTDAYERQNGRVEFVYLSPREVGRTGLD